MERGKEKGWFDIDNEGVYGVEYVVIVLVARDKVS